MVISKVISIGSKAISKSDPMIVLFDNSIPDDLRDVSVIQEVTSTAQDFKVQAGSKIKIDGKEYTADIVGSLVNTNLHGVGHVTLIFEKPQNDALASAIYLTPHELPELKVGSEIEYN